MNGFKQKAENFFAGKGFYIVLILCVAVIGASAWYIAKSMMTVPEDTGLTDAMETQPVYTPPVSVPGPEQETVTLPPETEEDPLPVQGVPEETEPVSLPERTRMSRFETSFTSTALAFI